MLEKVMPYLILAVGSLFLVGMLDAALANISAQSDFQVLLGVGLLPFIGYGAYTLYQYGVTVYNATQKGE
jgi:hypothetical protein